MQRRHSELNNRKSTFQNLSEEINNKLAIKNELIEKNFHETFNKSILNRQKIEKRRREIENENRRCSSELRSDIT